jgi:hypothetical protein
MTRRQRVGIGKRPVARTPTDVLQIGGLRYLPMHGDEVGRSLTNVYGNVNARHRSLSGNGLNL